MTRTKQGDSNKIDPAARTVAEAMTADPVTATPDWSVRKLARLLFEHEISGVPVVNRRGRLVGVVSTTDLLRWCVKRGFGFGFDDVLSQMAQAPAAQPQTIDLATVGDLMTANVLVARAHERLSDIAGRMSTQRVHRLVVVDDQQRVIGIVTSLDVLSQIP